MVKSIRSRLVEVYKYVRRWGHGRKEVTPRVGVTYNKTVCESAEPFVSI
jgi:hypothetical protein